ncbi:MAG: hypothetical protein KDB00_10735 [Planctomycetales bacterium]|nr:hypothetical protein [Planctomycetales bacterium]
MAKDSNDTDHRPIRRILRRMIKAPAVWSLLWPMLLLIGSYVAYSRWFAPRMVAQYGTLDPAAVTLSPAHEYVRTDLVSEVYRDTRLSELSPLDRRVTEKLASAFVSNPWVKHVRSVRKLPGGKIEIDVDYRRPVAVFHLTGDKEWLQTIDDYLASIGAAIQGGADNAYFPLDGDGVLLPTEKMTSEDTRNLIHIEVSRVFPTGTKGTPFGDRRVESAALLAKLLDAVRDNVRVAKIVVSGDPRFNLVPELELTLGDGTQLFWGSPPGMEQPNERDARAKLADLLSGNYVSGSNLKISQQRLAPIR